MRITKKKRGGGVARAERGEDEMGVAPDALGARGGVTLARRTDAGVVIAAPTTTTASLEVAPPLAVVLAQG